MGVIGHAHILLNLKDAKDGKVDVGPHKNTKRGPSSHATWPFSSGGRPSASFPHLSFTVLSRPLLASKCVLSFVHFPPSAFNPSPIRFSERSVPRRFRGQGSLRVRNGDRPCRLPRQLTPRSLRPVGRFRPSSRSWKYRSRGNSPSPPVPPAVSRVLPPNSPPHRDRNCHVLSPSLPPLPPSPLLLQVGGDWAGRQGWCQIRLAVYW